MFQTSADSHTFNQMSHSDKIVKIAESWLNTPYQHQARLKGVGVDCAQFIAGVADELFEKRINTPIYSQEWFLHNREELLCDILENFGFKRVDKMLLGDVLTFKYGRVNSHLGILVSEEEIIHARIDVGKVVKNNLTGDLLERLDRVYRFPDNL